MVRQRQRQRHRGEQRAESESAAAATRLGGDAKPNRGGCYLVAVKPEFRRFAHQSKEDPPFPSQIRRPIRISVGAKDRKKPRRQLVNQALLGRKRAPASTARSCSPKKRNPSEPYTPYIGNAVGERRGARLYTRTAGQSRRAAESRAHAGSTIRDGSRYPKPLARLLRRRRLYVHPGPARAFVLFSGAPLQKHAGTSALSRSTALQSRIKRSSGKLDNSGQQTRLGRHM